MASVTQQPKKSHRVLSKGIEGYKFLPQAPTTPLPNKKIWKLQYPFLTNYYLSPLQTRTPHTTDILSKLLRQKYSPTSRKQLYQMNTNRQ